jgi:hypothetical protein
LLQRALAIREKIFGSGHPDTALTLSNLALLFFMSTSSDKPSNSPNERFRSKRRLTAQIASEFQQLQTALASLNATKANSRKPK